MMAARLLPVQDTKTPVNGPKIAPFNTTIGSVGIGVAERIAISKIENSGPAIPVVGIYFSTFLISLVKMAISRKGAVKVRVVIITFFAF